MVSKGLHVTEIARETGIHKSTISRRLRKLNPTRNDAVSNQNSKNVPPMALDKVFEVVTKVEVLLTDQVNALDEIIRKNTVTSKSQARLIHELAVVFQRDEIKDIIVDEKELKEYRKKIDIFVRAICYSPDYLQKHVIKAIELRGPILQALDSIKAFLYNHSVGKEVTRIVLEEIAKESQETRARIFTRIYNRQQELKEQMERSKTFSAQKANP
jgi:transposase